MGSEKADCAKTRTIPGQTRLREQDVGLSAGRIAEYGGPVVPLLARAGWPDQQQRSSKALEQTGSAGDAEMVWSEGFDARRAVDLGRP